MCSTSPRGRTLLGLGIALGLMSLSLPAIAHSDSRGDAGGSSARHRASSGHSSSGSEHGHGERHRRGRHPRPFYGWSLWHGGGFWHGFAHWKPWLDDRPLCNYLLYVAEIASSEHKHDQFLALASLFGCEPTSSEPPVPEATAAPPPDATIVDANGAPIAEIGHLELDGDFFRVPLADSTADKVVLLGPPTARDAEPGVVRLEGMDADGFRVRFAEWAYLDGIHEMEDVSYLVLSPGRHRLADGSEWEVGTLELGDGGVFGNVTFTAPFDAQPALFLSVQTAGGGDPLVVRARNVSESGFQAALFEEEGADGLHDPQRVGYLAVVSPSGSGRVETTAGSLPYLVRAVSASDQPVPVLSTLLWLEEEASIDDESTHADETVAFMAIGSKVFAQDLSSADLDTAAVRRKAPEYGPVLEWGTVPDVDDGWHTVPLAREYTDPVVVVGPMSANDLDPGVLRVRNVTPDAFELRVEDWTYLDPAHAAERAFYMVADPGLQSLAGLVVEAGRVVNTQAVVSRAMENVTFALPFADAPGVFTSVMTSNDDEAVTVRVSDRTPDGFSMAMQEQEANTNAMGHMDETLGWIAIQAGSGITTDGRTVSVFDAGVDHTPLPVPFGATMSGRFPLVLAKMVSLIGLDTSEVRYLSLDPDAVTLVVEEEQSLDDEIKHVMEDVSVFVAE